MSLLDGVPETVVDELRRRLAVVRQSPAPVVTVTAGPAQVGDVGQQAASRLARLAPTLYAARDLGEVMSVVAATAVTVFDGAHCASLTTAGTDGALHTVAATGDLADRVDAMQVGVGEGPAVTQATTPGVSTVSAADLEGESRWPAFCADAVQAGVRSVLCAGLYPEAELGPEVPLPLASLNLYAPSPSAFTAVDLELVVQMCRQAAVAIASAVALQEAREHCDQLTEALASRDVIGQAKGIIMERHKMTEASAFKLLRTTSTRLNVKLHDLAETIAATGEAPDQQESARERDPSSNYLLRIERLSDTALARLDTEELLTELLDRVREMLGADTATVLLLHGSGTHLVATASRGVEEEVTAGVRVPVGKGFAGRVFAEQQPVVLRKVDASTVVNPILVQKGIRSLLGVPLVTSGEPIGVLHVGTLRHRRFTPRESDLLQRVGDRIALALRAQRSVQERAAAQTLADSLLPTRLPEVSGLELAARYSPDRVGGVSGDWYDVLPLPGGRLGMVLGDVAGHGLDAAIVMGRLRSALRAYALVDEDPAVALEHLDRKMHHFETASMAKVAYGIVSADRDELELSLAGHLPPALAQPHQPTTVLDLVADPPLGVSPDLRRRSHRVQVPPGGLLCLFSDGVVTRRHSNLDTGLRRVEKLLTAGDADRACATVMTMLLDPDRVHDDATVLAAHRLAFT